MELILTAENSNLPNEMSPSCPGRSVHNGPSDQAKPPFATSCNAGEYVSSDEGANGKIATADGSRPGWMIKVPSLRWAK